MRLATVNNNLMDFVGLFGPKSREAKAFLRSLTDGYNEFGSGLLQPPRTELEWERLLTYAEQACAFSEALVRQTDVCTVSTPFKFPFKWLSSPKTCNCAWSVAFSASLLLIQNVLFEAQSRENRDVSQTMRMDWHKILPRVIGVGTYLTQRVLPAWCEEKMDTPISEALEMPRDVVESWIHILRAYTLWNYAHLIILEEENQNTYATQRFVNPAVCETASTLFFTAYEILRRNVPPETNLGWGRLYRRETFVHSCDRVLVTQTELSVPDLQRLTEKNKQGPIATKSWGVRALVDWVVVVGMLYEYSNRLSDAVVCMRVAVINGAYLPGFSGSALTTMRHNSSVRDSTFSQLTNTLKPTLALQQGKLPIDWENDMAISTLTTQVLPLQR